MWFFFHKIHCPTRKLKRSNKHVYLSVCLRPETIITLTTKQDSKCCNAILDISYLFQYVCMCACDVPVLSCMCTSVQVGKLNTGCSLGECWGCDCTAPHPSSRRLESQGTGVPKAPQATDGPKVLNLRDLAPSRSATPRGELAQGLGSQETSWQQAQRSRDSSTQHPPKPPAIDPAHDNKTRIPNILPQWRRGDPS